MPAKSENQRRAAGMALSAKRGKTSPDKLRGAAKEMYNGMSETDLEHFATKSGGYSDTVDDLSAIFETAKTNPNALFKGLARSPMGVSPIKNVMILGALAAALARKDKLKKGLQWGATGAGSQVGAQLGNKLYNAVTVPGQENVGHNLAAMALGGLLGGRTGYRVTGSIADALKRSEDRDEDEDKQASLVDTRIDEYFNAFRKVSEMSDNPTFEEKKEDMMRGEITDIEKPERDQVGDGMDNMFKIGPRDTKPETNLATKPTTSPHLTYTETSDTQVSPVDRTKEIMPPVTDVLRRSNISGISSRELYPDISDMGSGSVEEGSIRMTEKEKVAFIIGFAEECMDRHLAEWEVKMASAVAAKLLPNQGTTFEKVSAVVGAMGSQPDVKVKEDVVKQVEPMKQDNPANDFMTGYAQRQIKEKKLTKGGVTPSPATVFKGDGNRMAIKAVAGKR